MFQRIVMINLIVGSINVYFGLLFNAPLHALIGLFCFAVALIQAAEPKR